MSRTEERAKQTTVPTTRPVDEPASKIRRVAILIRAIRNPATPVPVVKYTTQLSLGKIVAKAIPDAYVTAFPIPNRNTHTIDNPNNTLLFEAVAHALTNGNTTDTPAIKPIEPYIRALNDIT